MADPVLFCDRCQASIARDERSVQFGGKTLCVACSQAVVKPSAPVAPPASEPAPAQGRSGFPQAEPPPHWDARVASLVLCAVGVVVAVGGLVVLIKGADKRAELVAAAGAGVIVMGLIALGVGQLVHLLMHVRQDVWRVKRLLEIVAKRGM